VALATTVTFGSFYPAGVRAEPGLPAPPDAVSDGHSHLETLSKGLALLISQKLTIGSVSPTFQMLSQELADI